MAEADDATQKQIDAALNPDGKKSESDSEVDDTNEDSDVDTDGETDEEDNDDEDNDWTPPTKEVFERSERSRLLAKGEAKKYRLRVKELEKELESAKSGPDNADGKAVERAKLEAETVVIAKYRGIIGRTAAKAGLLSVGCKPESVNRLVKLIDYDDVELDDSGEVVDGLEEQIEDLKKEFEELFVRKNPTKRQGADGGGRRPGQQKPMTVTERQIALAQGRL